MRLLISLCLVCLIQAVSWAQAAGGSCSIYLSSRPSGASISIDGKPTGKQTPAMISGLTPGTHDILLEWGDYIAEKRMVLETGALSRHELTLKLKPVKLLIHTQPESAAVILNNRQIGFTPLTYELDNPATCEFRFSREQFLPQDTVIFYGERRSYELTVELSPAAVLKVHSDPMGADVFLDNSFYGVTPYENIAPAGQHTLQLMLGDYQEFRRDIYLPQAETVFVLALMEKLQGTLSIRGLPQGAAIYLNGIFLANTPLDKFPVEVGEYDLTYRMVGYEPPELPYKVTITQDKDVVVILKSRRKTPLKGVVRSMVFPGWGQHYVERHNKGYIYTAGELVLLTGAGASLILYNQSVTDYYAARDEYLMQIEEDDILRDKAKMNQRYDDMERFRNLRDGLVLLSAGFYLWNVIDVFIWGTPPEKKAPSVSLKLQPQGDVVVLKMNYQF